MSNFNELLRDVQTALSLPTGPVAEAVETWSTLRAAFAAGLQDGERDDEPASAKNEKDRYVGIQDRYLAIARYCSDTKELIAYYGQGQGNSEQDIFAVDPHLLSAYSEYWVQKKHTGFNFLRPEFEAAQGNESLGESQDVQLYTRYQLFVYSSIFRDGRSAILDAGRSEIADNLAYFMGPDGPSTQTALDVGALITELDRALVVHQTEGSSESEWLWGKFSSLMQVGSGPLVQQRLAQARLVAVFNASTFRAPESAVRNALAGQTQHKNALEDFSRLLGYFRNNPAFVLNSHRQLVSAYMAFLKSTRYDPDSSDEPMWDQASTSLRKGEISNIRALHEVHVLNTCLSVLQLPVQFRYITQSLALFNFISRFDRKMLRIPLAHPRSAILLRQDGMFRIYKDEFENVVASSIASGNVMPKDGKISLKELNKFEAENSRHLISVRNTFVYSVVDDKDQRNIMINELKYLFNGEGLDQQQQEKADKILEKIEAVLKRDVEEVGKKYKENSEGYASTAWSAYQRLFKEFYNQSFDILMRKFTFKKSSRIVCVPITGAYRYMFILHNHFVDEVFSKEIEDAVGRLSVFEMMKRVETASEKMRTTKKSESPVQSLRIAKAEALSFFVRAVFAASNREWILANSLAARASNQIKISAAEKKINPKRRLYLDDLGPDSNFISALQENNPEHSTIAKAMLIHQEILLLSHLCRRAIAESSEPSRRNITWLLRSARDLNTSAMYTLHLPKPLSIYYTTLHPVSVRQTLASAGLLIEWLAAYKKVGRRQSGTAREGQTADAALPGILLPETDAAHICWSELSVLCRLPESIEAFDIGLVGLALDTVVLRIKAAIAALNDHLDGTASRDSEARSHTPEFWNYLLLRAHSMRVLLRACIDTELLPQPTKTMLAEIGDVELKEIANVYSAHRAFVGNCPPLSKEDAGAGGAQVTPPDQYSLGQPDRNPFLAALLAAANISQNATCDDTGKLRVAHPGELFAAFAQLEVNCNALDSFGFPRRVVRAVKEKYAPWLRHQLDLDYPDSDLPPEY
jgi:hypothetical protein